MEDAQETSKKTNKINTHYVQPFEDPVDEYPKHYMISEERRRELIEEDERDMVLINQFLEKMMPSESSAIQEFAENNILPDLNDHKTEISGKVLEQKDDSDNI